MATASWKMQLLILFVLVAAVSGQYGGRVPRGYEYGYDDDDDYMYQQAYGNVAPSPPPPAPRRNMPPGQTLDDATAYGEKGTMYMRRGDYMEALRTYDSCLRIQLVALGDRHPMVAQTIDLMGVAFLRLGKVREASETFEKALLVYEAMRVDGNTAYSVDWALTVMHIGQALELEAENHPKVSAYKIDGEVDSLTNKAYQYYQEALEVFQVEERDVPDGADLDIANIMHCMGNVHNIRGEYMQALRKYKLALKDKIELLGEKDVSVGWTKCNIGNSLRGIGKIDEAIKWYTEALETVTRHLGTHHPEVAHVHWNLALAHQNKGETEADRRASSWRNVWFLRPFLGSARRLGHEGYEFQRMEKHLRHAFDVFEKRLGDDHMSLERAKEAIIALEQLKRD